MSLFNDLMQLSFNVTCSVLGLDPTTFPQNIRPLDYRDSPAGLKTPDDDIIFYMVRFGNESLNRRIDDLTQPNSNPALTTRTIQYCRNLIFDWQVYGENGFENADKIRIALYSDPAIKELFAEKNISLIPEIPEPFFVPEPIGQQWYKRYDLSARFNQLVTSTSTVPAVSGTDIIIEDEKGVVGECSVSIP